MARIDTDTRKVRGPPQGTRSLQDLCLSVPICGYFLLHEFASVGCDVLARGMSRRDPHQAATTGARSPAAWKSWGLPLLLGLAALVAYSNTFSAPFIFDDLPAIAQNPTIRDLGRPSELLAPPALRGSGVAGRPIVNLSLALNRALGGEEVWGYHTFNLFVHVGAGLALFGLVRRACRLPVFASRGENGAEATGFFVAVLWLVHPLQTEAVTCIIQRTESLAGLFYLATFYAFVRSVTGDGSRGWAVAAWMAAWLGAATKEILVTAPVLLLLFDRTFVAGSFRESWRKRGRFFIAVATTTWLTVAALVWRSETRGGTVGFGHGVTAWEYLLTQARALVLYFKLAWWPHPLVLDYGTEVVRDVRSVWLQGFLVLIALAGTGWALWRRPVVGFLGAWFFVILAPSSSFVPLVTQTMAEHRMYLPLAALVVLAVVGLQRWAKRWWQLAATTLALVLAVTTIARNADYRSAESIWRDTATKWPTNPRAHYTLAQLADAAGRHAEAIEHGEAAVRLVPDDPTAQFNLAFSFAAAARFEEALVHYRAAARLRPRATDALVNAGAILVRLGRLDEAIAEYEQVVRLKPESGEDWFNLAEVYRLANRGEDALRGYQTAARLKPDLPDVFYRLGNACLGVRRVEEAVTAFREGRGATRGRSRSA